jgi:hypothetical protein
MHNTCSGPNCSPQSYGPSQQCGSSCGCKSSCGPKKPCPTEQLAHSPAEMASELIEAALCAKKMLMKEKLKAQFEKKMGQKMDEIADVVTSAILDMWKNKQGGIKLKHETVSKLESIMKSAQ